MTTTTIARPVAQDVTLTAFRVVVSFLFGCHGLMGFGLFGGIDGQGGAVEAWSFPGWWASVIEVGGAAFVLLGVGARVAALLCSGTMAYAYFVVHQPEGLLPVQNMGEPAVMFCWAFLVVAVVGPGSYTLDRVFRR
ncbi:DoxX family protein [Saccharothrix violaceirubra]|uniref:Putative oxidoreductase n=1 Tax=Saccharothrix violaceirubra TaxID=413306 RepID=A0A7W7WTM9_9PSEU|nr:DoxX family protein [Saccharothrix violaceirubra]MBB4963346.1 putative oxidoreductase [Saccharothrix violaceirubra]